MDRFLHRSFQFFTISATVATIFIVTIERSFYCHHFLGDGRLRLRRLLACCAAARIWPKQPVEIVSQREAKTRREIDLIEHMLVHWYRLAELHAAQKLQRALEAAASH